MKILLLSDNHAHVDPAFEKHVAWADEVWHAGDWLNLDLHEKILGLKKPIVGVHGNVDGTDVRVIYPNFMCFEREGVRVFMTHIGGKPGKYPEKMLNIAREYAAGLYICGHSHILKVQYDKVYQWLFMNPGACGLHGFHQIRTALRFEIKDSQIVNLEIIEWPRKNAINF